MLLSFNFGPALGAPSSVYLAKPTFIIRLILSYGYFSCNSWNHVPKQSNAFACQLNKCIESTTGRSSSTFYDTVKTTSEKKNKDGL